MYNTVPDWRLSLQEDGMTGMGSNITCLISVSIVLESFIVFTLP